MCTGSIQATRSNPPPTTISHKKKPPKFYPVCLSFFFLLGNGAETMQHHKQFLKGHPILLLLLRPRPPPSSSSCKATIPALPLLLYTHCSSSSPPIPKKYSLLCRGPPNPSPFHEQCCRHPLPPTRVGISLTLLLLLLAPKPTRAWCPVSSVLERPPSLDFGIAEQMQLRKGGGKSVGGGKKVSWRRIHQS